MGSRVVIIGNGAAQLDGVKVVIVLKMGRQNGYCKLANVIS